MSILLSPMTYVDILLDVHHQESSRDFMSLFGWSERAHEKGSHADDAFVKET
jgi:hypothetical protein